MSHRILAAFFSLLLATSFTSSAYASTSTAITGKPHKNRHVKKVKKVKKPPHHRSHCR
jgi:hypothetical protein